MIGVDQSFTFGQWLRVWRTAKGMSIKGAAQIAGWKPQFWSNLEHEGRTRRGGQPPKPDEQTVKVIARVLDIPLEIVMLAAGHAPAEFQAQMFALLPARLGDTYPTSEQFPNLLLVCSDCNAAGKLSLAEVAPSADDREKNLQLIHISDVHLSDVGQRLHQVESNVEKIMRLLEGLSQNIKTNKDVPC